jgi:hypothetical protein
MSASKHKQERPIAEVEEPEPGGERKPDPVAEGAETNEPDSAAEQEPATKRNVLVTISDCVCAALGCATSVR